MKTSISSISSKMFIPIVICVYLGMLLVSAKYYNNPYLHFDEAGQFWIAKGLNHDSAPFSACGSLKDVIENNKYYNLDPGGFGIILHYWTKVSNKHHWLRVLPFSFFLLTIAGIIFLTYNWTKNKYIASLVGLIPFMNWMILKEAFEVRAYSMEVLGVVVCIMAVESLKKSISYGKLLAWSVLIALFMTSRYSFIIVAFVTSTCVLYLILKQSTDKKNKISQICIYAFPLLVMLILIYIFALRYQNPRIEALLYLRYIKTDPQVLLERPSKNIVILVGLLMYLVYLFKGKKIISRYQELLYVTIVTNILFIILSILGLHPWSGSCIRIISAITLLIITSCAMAGELLKLLFSKTDTKYIILCFLSLELSCVGYDLHDTYKGRNNAYSDFLSANYTLGKVFVDRFESPGFRYLFEYGKLKGSKCYPNNFTFCEGGVHARSINPFRTAQQLYSNNIFLNDLYESYDMLIAPELYLYKPENHDRWTSINDNHRVWVKSNEN